MTAVEIKFSVTATTKPGEILCIVGNVPKLGEWDPQKSKVLRLEKTLDDGLVFLNIFQYSLFFIVESMYKAYYS